MKRPVAEGVPPIANRPRCAWCGQRLKPRINNIEKKVGDTIHFRTEISRRVFAGYEAYDGLFHSLRCALDFATAAHKVGYRRTP